jgi:hypothetical protein
MTGGPHRQETVPASGRRTPPRRRRCLPRQAATIPASHPPDCPTGPPAATASVLGLPGRQRPGSAAAGLRAGDRAARWHVYRRRWRSLRVRSWTRTPRSQSARRAGNGHARLPIDDPLVTRRDDVTRESRIEGRRIRRYARLLRFRPRAAEACRTGCYAYSLAGIVQLAARRRPGRFARGIRPWRRRGRDARLAGHGCRAWCT